MLLRAILLHDNRKHIGAHDCHKCNRENRLECNPRIAGNDIRYSIQKQIERRMARRRTPRLLHVGSLEGSRLSVLKKKAIRKVRKKK